MGQTASQPVASPSACPMHQKSAAPPAQCPVSHQSSAAQCPVAHDTLSPLNQMPVLSQAPAPHQSAALPTDRTLSSIPKAEEANAKWEYPSPQQFYNALVRKGWETPEEHVETMVQIHNFLNERAWEEVLRWEREHNGDDNVQLERFMGKPGTLSPKARFMQFAGWLLPDRFSAEPPFDRHDWLIHRPRTNESIRYVIDYYSAPPEPDGSPVFSLDVRPALDGWEGVRMRIGDLTEGAWKKEREREARRT